MSEQLKYLVSDNCADLLRNFAQDKELRGVPSSVFLLVLSAVALEQANICVAHGFAKRLSTNCSTVSRAFNLLCKKGILHKVNGKYAATASMYTVLVDPLSEYKMELPKEKQKKKPKSAGAGLRLVKDTPKE